MNKFFAIASGIVAVGLIIFPEPAATVAGVVLLLWTFGVIGKK